MYKRTCLAVLLLGMGAAVAAQGLDEPRIGQLALQFLPEPVRADYASEDSLDELEDPIGQYHRSKDPKEMLIGNFTYLDF